MPTTGIAALKDQIRIYREGRGDYDHMAVISACAAIEAELTELRAEIRRLRDGNEFISRELGRAQADADQERCQRIQLEETDNNQLEEIRTRLLRFEKVASDRAAQDEVGRAERKVLDILANSSRMRLEYWLKDDEDGSILPLLAEAELARRKLTR